MTLLAVLILFAAGVYLAWKLTEGLDEEDGEELSK